ncbi:Peptidoglycan/LPS O-acetylase OafA/YrhL, contains acyltransferase and SGNH-hydrolase domains [Nakamurella panacisegetis]|uniref:Peptidoglycan/LPS O-acetylase OafA/YrhL, contains acyltransferase and SGNH-hydrolase domains n=1 Tax=Nakamurella panacisegetis TaxID=1090615 RepID=A0A1H0SBF3_9ACTN|nr:acyltransferase family protein [Nakamurella panacisegetis]SDP39141.1 Peptidoglycan/LPS O-acetylase OafA/YrhL, contains acyltransferase and SGNH-hydrolase domains [Nakamurella panacisegetis]
MSSPPRPGEPRPAGAGGLTVLGDRRFRPDIQGLRTVAVLLVVLYHCAVPVVRGGYVGVDVFFVISGFLITRQLITEHHRAGRVSLSSFYARRIKRLLPMALTVVLCTEVAARFFGPALQSATVARDGIFATFYLMNFRLATQGIDYQNAGGPVSPLQHFWSLAVEEQFYIGWPLIIVLLGLAFRGRTRTAALTVAGLVGVGSLLISIVDTRQNPALAYFAIQTRAWELAVGAAIALATPMLLRLPQRFGNAASWVGLLLIGASAVFFTDATQFPGAAAAVPVGGAALIVAAGLKTTAGSAQWFLGRPAMQFGGRMSYGWYLWHWPLIVLAPSILATTHGWWGNVVVAAAALGLSVISYHVIEAPVARRPVRRGRWFAIGAGLSIVVTAAAVLITVLPTAGLYNSGPAAALQLGGADAAALTAELQRAYDRPEVPSNLAPTLTDAVHDVPVTSSDGCHAEFLAVTVPLCVFGDPAGTRTIVLFGDSHAQQWFGGLDALARSRGWRLVSWTKAACPLADALFYNAQLERPYSECTAWRSATIAKIAALDPDLVVASGADALPGPAYSNRTWAAQTTTSLSALKRAARQVVFLADTPLPGTNVPVCLAANIRTPQNCQFTRRSQTSGATEQNQQPARHAAVVSAAAADGVAVVDPTDWFCSATGCPAVVADTLLYRDATHITQAYSTALAPVLGRGLAAVVPWIARGR